MKGKHAMLGCGRMDQNMAQSTCKFTPMDLFSYLGVPLLAMVLLTSCIFGKTQDTKTHVVIGEVADLNNKIFSEKSWQKGFYKPDEFAKETGVGIYFLEEYDPRKVPVLFINGINGSPQLWHLFFNGMDRKRFQPWFFSYPTGMSLTESTGLLNELLEGLRKAYGFNEMYITAHGTGGLLARAAILMHRREEHPNYITVFVSIATPWGGYKNEAAGELDLTDTIPSLVDIRTDSQFLRSLYRKRMGFSLDHYLFVAYGTGRLSVGPMGGPPNLKTQLYSPAQIEAEKEYGFYENYLGILGSEEVVRKYNKILAK